MAMLAIMAFLSILYAQPVTAQGVTVTAWTDLRQYEPGQTGKLYITVRNDLPDTDVIIKNISIMYVPWHAYVKDHWEGNESFTNIDQICKMDGGVYYKEVTFTVPTGGRGVSAQAGITVKLDKTAYNPGTEYVGINVVGSPYPMTIEDMDLWMTSLTVAVVVCTIILAIVIFLATRSIRAPGAFIPRAAVPPPPPKPKAKA
jgi:hypothetical protein